MFDIYDSETVVKIYRMLNKKCEAIDSYINSNALYMGSNELEYGSCEVYNNIIELIERKSQLINLKLIIDEAVKTLNNNSRKTLLIKMNFNMSMDKMCQILDVKGRTGFRYLENAYLDLASALNKSKYSKKLDRILQNELWISPIKREIVERRSAIKQRGLA